MDYEDIKEIKSMSPQKLAFFGDAVFELMMRKRIIFEKSGNIGSVEEMLTLIIRRKKLLKWNIIEPRE